MFTDSYLEALSGRKQFCWNWLPSKGSAGGILLGVNKDVFEVENWVIREFSVSCDVVDKNGGFKGRITTIYGAADDSRRQEFIEEIHCMLNRRKEPTIIGGDFNMVRYQKDKSNGVIDFRWCDKFID
jgi:hypothetical protein